MTASSLPLTVPVDGGGVDWLRTMVVDDSPVDDEEGACPGLSGGAGVGSDVDFPPDEAGAPHIGSTVIRNFG